MHMRMIGVLEKLEQLIEQQGSGSLTLASVWKLGKSLHDDIQAGAATTDQEIQWLNCSKSATKRLRGLVLRMGPYYIISLLNTKDEGKVKEAKDMLGQMMGLTGRLQGIRAVLEESQDGWELYSKDVAPTDLGAVCKNLAIIVKVVGYDLNVIEMVQPGAKDHVNNYMAKVYNVLGDVVKSTEKDANEPVLAAAEMWQPEKVAEVSWMFKPNQPDVDKATKEMLEFRDKLPSRLPAMKGITACKAGLKPDSKMNGLVNLMLQLQGKIEALNTETAAVIGTMMAMEVVVNQDTYKDKLEVTADKAKPGKGSKRKAEEEPEQPKPKAASGKAKSSKGSSTEQGKKRKSN
ncbi:unnamed protein product [Durusdinium trenchii]|uniref:Uncharacterized protein n=1 Tax=Durusdinium trenchii TaxID=1381693 RepID=A0ABP0L4Y8_9DINO